MEIGRGVRRIGGGMVNAYLLEEAGRVTIVDTGLPGYWSLLPDELSAMGRRMEDIEAVLLTHAHSDHVGFAERIRRERGVPIRIHPDDAALARGETKVSGQSLRPFRLLPLLRFMAYGLRWGLRVTPISAVTTFDDGATIDVPGTPRAIHLPGHSPGCAAFHVPALDALFVGDALATLNVMTGVSGPQIAPFTADVPRARSSLGRLEGVEAGLVLPGHGAAWTGGVAEAVRLARATSAPAA